MKKPSKRIDIPPRSADNNKRRLSKDASDKDVANFLGMKYGGSPKHKRNPTIFGLEPFNGNRGDATLCDDHSNFQPADMSRVPNLINRGLDAKLIGTNFWTIDDNGWIYEARLTNISQNEYHGYPVRPGEAIADQVFRKFKAWAEQYGTPLDKTAAQNCAVLYGL